MKKKSKKSKKTNHKANRMLIIGIVLVMVSLGLFIYVRNKDTYMDNVTPTKEYQVKYVGMSVIDTGFNPSVKLDGSSKVPVVKSKTLKLNTNTEYVVSFDYKVEGGTNNFRVDLYPDDLPEVKLTAKTTKQHYTWLVSSKKSSIKNCNLRFFDDIQESNEKDIIITNIHVGTIKTVKIKQNASIGSLPTPTRKGYKFLGWYTSATGGTKVTKSTKITKNITLYSRWQMIKLPETFTLPKGFSEVKDKSYTSDTLVYRTIKKDKDNFYSIVWIADAYQQLNSANNNFNGQSRQELLKREIKSMNYQKKGMISTNGSFTISDRSNTPIIVSKGQMFTNNRYAAGYMYSILTLGSDYNLKWHTTYSKPEAKEWLTKVGARNTWAVTLVRTNNWSTKVDSVSDRRTAICQVDANNYVLYTGLATRIDTYMTELHRLFNCKTIANLDGGGSTGMFYKTNTMSSVGTIYMYARKNNAGGYDTGRVIGDMLYFVEL